MQNKLKSKLIIILLFLLMLLLICLVALMIAIQFGEKSNSTNIRVDTTVSRQNGTDTPKGKNVKEVVEYYDSKYINRTNGVIVKIYINSKYDLFDENGKSKESYFKDLVNDIALIEKSNFYLIDTSKRIEIFVEYKEDTGKCAMTINSQEDFYDEVDGEIYVDLAKTEIVKMSNLTIQEETASVLGSQNMYYSRTLLVSEDRELLPNGYYSYLGGTMLAKLHANKAVNLIYTKDFKERIAKGIYVTTELDEIEGLYSNLAFGSVSEGFLAYRTDNLYVFFYGDEVSIWDSQYEERSEFDQYLTDYCASGDLEKLAKDFTEHWTNYYQYEYNPELESLYLSYPSRGLEINIKNNDSRGIIIYNNYYLTEAVKDLIKGHQITLEPNKNLVLITEQSRKESMK